MTETSGTTESGTVVDISQQCTENEVPNVTLPDVGSNTFGSIVEADVDNGVTNVAIPEVGMTFGSPDEAYEFYLNYSFKIGFSVTKRSTHKKDYISYNVTFACNKNRKPKTPMPEKESDADARRARGAHGTGCRAHIYVTDRAITGSWLIERVVLEHNHELSPNSMNLIMRCHRPDMAFFLKNQLGINNNKSFTAVFTQDNGVTKCSFSQSRVAKRLGLNGALFSEKDIGIVLRGGDVVALKNYFVEQQLRCADFFYSYDVDDDCRIRNAFWADGRSRSAFKYFSDVVTFDTTYLVYRYRMPFVVFGGVNHHGQSILLGCALLANESKETYVWLFKTLLGCMRGKAPAAMITDQCEAICEVLSEVFPDTRHRLCLWHIVKGVAERLAGCNERDQVRQLICNAVYDSTTHEEFEQKWCSILKDFELGSHREWFVNLYEIRHKWVPVFVKHQFWAGMSTTQQGKNTNAFFDGVINSCTSIKTFFEKYNSVLHSKREKEIKEDFRCKGTKPKLISGIGFETQIAKVYTLRLFYEFQKELKTLMTCWCEIVESHDGSTKFVVFEGVGDQKKRTVTYCTENSEYVCDCLLFQFRGFVCRHALCVYRQMRVDYIPQCYIMNRWRKDYVMPSHIRHMATSQIVQELIEIASQSKALSEVIFSGLNALKQKLHDRLADTEEPVSNKRRRDEETTQNNQTNKSQSTAGTPVATPDQFGCDIDLLMHFHRSSMEQC